MFCQAPCVVESEHTSRGTRQVRLIFGTMRSSQNRLPNKNASHQSISVPRFLLLLEFGFKVSALVKSSHFHTSIVV